MRENAGPNNVLIPHTEHTSHSAARSLEPPLLLPPNTPTKPKTPAPNREPTSPHTTPPRIAEAHASPPDQDDPRNHQNHNATPYLSRAGGKAEARPAPSHPPFPGQRPESKGHLKLEKSIECCFDDRRCQVTTERRLGMTSLRPAPRAPGPEYPRVSAPIPNARTIHPDTPMKPDQAREELYTPDNRTSPRSSILSLLCNR